MLRIKKEIIMTETISYLAVKQWLIAIVLAVGSFFAPIKMLLIGSLVLVTVDFITGVWAARVRKEKVTSKKFYNSVSKLVGYSLLIIVAHHMTNIFFHDADIDFASLAGMFIGYIEFKSFTENMYKISGNPMWEKLFNIIPELKFLKNGNTGADSQTNNRGDS